MGAARVIGVIVMSLAGMLGVLAAMLVAPESENAAGVAHATIDAMSIGGDGAGRAKDLGWLPYWLKVFGLSFVAGLIALGISPAKRTTQVITVLALIWGVQQVVWWLVWSSYQSAIGSQSVAIVLGFPLPTAWALYASFPSLALYAVFYIGFFRTIIWSHEDEVRFDALVEKAEKGQV